MTCNMPTQCSLYHHLLSNIHIIPVIDPELAIDWEMFIAFVGICLRMFICCCDVLCTTAVWFDNITGVLGFDCGGADNASDWVTLLSQIFRQNHDFNFGERKILVNKENFSYGETLGISNK